jgi:multiple sugar transport system ATP-binding protein
LRPESIALRPPGGDDIQGRVELVEALGAETLVYVTSDQGAQLVARLNSRTDAHEGDRVGVAVDSGTAHLFDAQGRVALTGSISGNAGNAWSARNA